MAQQLRALAALPEDQSVFNSQHPHGHSQLSVTPGPRFLTPSHRHTFKQITNTHKIRINYLFKKTLLKKEIVDTITA